jgi:hypothetical protein
MSKIDLMSGSAIRALPITLNYITIRKHLQQANRRRGSRPPALPAPIVPTRPESLKAAAKAAPKGLRALTLSARSGVQIAGDGTKNGGFRLRTKNITEEVSLLGD